MATRLSTDLPQMHAASHTLDPRIGMLMRAGKPVYYAFTRGYGKPETQGSLEEVEQALGLRLTMRPTVAQKPASLRAARRAKSKQAPVRSFEVTVTPRFLTYGSHGTNGEYTLTVDATSHAEALSMARQKRRDEEGRYGVPATFKARVLPD